MQTRLVPEQQNTFIDRPFPSTPMTSTGASPTSGKTRSGAASFLRRHGRKRKSMRGWIAET